MKTMEFFTESLIGAHAFLGEMGAVAFLWVLVEMLGESTPNRIKRAKIAALIGVIAIFASWIVGGFYYVEFYGSNVKPLIKDGPQPWAHSLITETKEHVFLFLPFLSLLVLGTLCKFKEAIASNRQARISVIILSLLVVLIAFSMAGMGFLISSGFRSAIETIAL